MIVNWATVWKLLIWFQLNTSTRMRRRWSWWQTWGSPPCSTPPPACTTTECGTPMCARSSSAPGRRSVGGVLYVYRYLSISMTVWDHIVICGNVNAWIPRSYVNFMVLAHVSSFYLSVYRSEILIMRQTWDKNVLYM